VSDLPSWLGPPAAASPVAAPPERDLPPAPATLVAAVVATAVLAVGEAVHVLGRGDLVPGFRLLLTLVVALQVVLAVLAHRRSSAAVLALFACLATTVLAAVGGGFGERRALYAAGAGVVAVLLARSLRAFPAPVLPPLDAEGRP
jgi:hypothetical protein